MTAFSWPRECSLCGWRGLRFRPMRSHRYMRWDAVCPSCGSLERHRAFAEYIGTEEELSGKIVLDIAPMKAFRAFFESRGALYVSTDLFSESMVRASLLDAPFADGAFDVVVCFHVLEHISDDRRAMRELARITGPGGRLYVQVPMDPQKAHSVEYDAPDRYNHFHVRDYGADFTERLAEEGLECRDLDLLERLGRDRKARIGATKAVGITQVCTVKGL